MDIIDKTLLRLIMKWHMSNEMAKHYCEPWVTWSPGEVLHIVYFHLPSLHHHGTLLSLGS